MTKLEPSILSADFGQLAADVKKIEEGGAHLIHVDVMDGHFVPNISFGAAVMKSLNRLQTAPYDVHLMIEDPDRYAADFVALYFFKQLRILNSAAYSLIQSAVQQDGNQQQC